MQDHIDTIARELGVKPHQVHNAVKLLFDEECTIPFVARYRKEATGSLDEVVLRSVRDRYGYLRELDASRDKYLKVVEDVCRNRPDMRGRFPELKKAFLEAQTKQALEDLYLPFKPKRRTRAMVAKEKGLEPLARAIMERAHESIDLAELALPYVKTDLENKELQVGSIDEALKGAADILAEQINETAALRSLVRDISFETGQLVAQKADLSKADQDKVEKKGSVHKYENYFDYREPISKAPSHRIMAVRRGEAEKILKVSIEVDKDAIIHGLKEQFFPDVIGSEQVRLLLLSVVEDAYKRLIAPSIETEIRLDLKTRAQEDAISVFSNNLENLLLLPPIPQRVVLGVDPGLRTGSKLAVVNGNGKLLEHDIVHIDLKDENGPKTQAAKEKILGLIERNKVEYVAIGNGTGSREIDRVIASIIREKQLTSVKRALVNEAGASVYSTDDIAREEFPNLDPTIRSAVSIARRLQDPLAELVKIDPKSIGVGQYQHDVNPSKLSQSLNDVVESCVNRVGVNLNTASHKLLEYVSGVGPALAKNIVKLRDMQGSFKSRAALREVGGMGEKAFQQAAGFLRIPDSENTLDNSAVHPESYGIVEMIAKDLGKSIVELVGDEKTVKAIPLEKYVTDKVGMPTLTDITSELIKPGRDPREGGTRMIYSEDVYDIEHLKEGMRLKGTITNVTNFGAFCDVGVHQDGLIHVSEISDTFVSDPSKVVSVGDVLDVRVIGVDKEKRRISLSLKSPDASRPRAERQEPRRPVRTDAAARPGGRQRRGPQRSPSTRRSPPSTQFTVEDLVNKFNKRN